MLQKVCILNARTWLWNILYSMIVLYHKAFYQNWAVIESMAHKFEKMSCGVYELGLYFLSAYNKLLYAYAISILT